MQLEYISSNDRRLDIRILKLHKTCVTDRMVNNMEEGRKWTNEGISRYEKLNNELRRKTVGAIEAWWKSEYEEHLGQKKPNRDGISTWATGSYSLMTNCLDMCFLALLSTSSCAQVILLKSFSPFPTHDSYLNHFPSTIYSCFCYDSDHCSAVMSVRA